MTGTWVRSTWILAWLLGVLGGCSSSSYRSDVPEPVVAGPVATAPVSEANHWVVKQGDTLYSIAFSAGLDWKDVAAANGIAPPYTIYPGQQIRLGEQAVAGFSPADAEPGTVRTQAAPEPGPPLTVAKPAASSPVPSTPATAPVRTAPPLAAAPPAKSAPVPKTAAPGTWTWPATGRLLRGFSTGAQPHKGVDLAGSAGDPVLAAREGTVVYAGSGVRGYGNLLIVKHDAQYLSAYAHNSRLLVKEGDAVNGGQRIAEVGDSGADRVKLHFEVRRQGSPVDPLRILPRR